MEPWISLYHAWRFAPGAQAYFASIVEGEASLADYYQETEIGICTVAWLVA